MKKVKVISIICFLLLAITSTKTFSQGTFSIHAGASVPVLDFGSSDVYNEDAGGAAVGLNLGIQYIYPLSESGFGLFLGADFNSNALTKDIQEDIEDIYEDQGLFGAEYTFYKYLNIPFSTGLNYTFHADENLAVFANAGITANILKMTDMVIEINNQKLTTVMDISGNIGFKAGGGILLKDKVSIAIEYFGLGTHDIDGEVKTTGYSEKIDATGKVDLVTINLGLQF